MSADQRGPAAAGRARWLAFGIGVLSAALVLAWQGVRVRYTYGGDWSALFCTGAGYPVPPELAHERLYLFEGGLGFDGQIYHYIAHDPIPPWRLHDFVDDPGLRYRRILVPLLAFLAAGGVSAHVDVAYRAVLLGFVLLGAYWVARYAAAWGRSPAWGIAFLLLPAVVSSAERLTLDVALAALCAGVAAHAGRGATPASWALLAAAGLARETGLLLVLAVAGHALWARQPRRAAWLASAALPTLAWFALVAAFARSHSYPVSWLPFSGIVNGFLHPIAYPNGDTDWLSRHWRAVCQAADKLALAGVAWALGLALLRMRRRPPGVLTLAGAAFSLQAALHNAPLDAWSDIDNFGRVYSPLLLMVALDSLGRGRPAGLLPPLLLWPRIGLGLLGALRAIRRGILG